MTGNSSDEPSQPTYFIRSVDHALQLLMSFRDAPTMTVAGVSDQLGVARSTAHRLLGMLQYYDMVQQEPGSKRYVAGPALMELGLSLAQGFDLRSVARAHLERLAFETGETVHLQALKHRSVFFLETVESRKGVRASARTGLVLPAHCTAGGKAVMATMTDDAINRLYSGEEELEPLTAHSLTDQDALLAELRQIRERGWAIGNQETEEGLCAISVACEAVPLAGAQNAALTVAGPSFRMSHRVEEIAEALRASLSQMVTEHSHRRHSAPTG